MYENRGKALLRSFAEYRDIGTRKPSDAVADTVKAVKKAVRVRSHPDHFHKGKFPEWPQTERDAL
eukprot:5768830-Alexandrium_andersonii.AAC.1